MKRCPCYDGARAAFSVTTVQKRLLSGRFSSSLFKKKFSFMQTHLFLLRLWREELGQAPGEWRGRVVSLESGEARYFRDTKTLYTVLRQILSNQADLMQFANEAMQVTEEPSSQIGAQIASHSSSQDSTPSNPSSQSTEE